MKYVLQVGGFRDSVLSYSDIPKCSHCSHQCCCGVTSGMVGIVCLALFFSGTFSIVFHLFRFMIKQDDLCCACFCLSRARAGRRKTFHDQF